MNAVRYLVLLFCFLLFSADSFSQDEDQTEAIQLAAYNSWAKFTKNKAHFVKQFNLIKFPAKDYSTEDVYVEKNGKWIKVYLLHDGSRATSLLKRIKARSFFKGAFRKAGLDQERLSRYETAYQIYHSRPSEYTVKSGRISTSKSAEGGKYKIQLGVFKERKALHYIADNFGFGSFDQQSVYERISHDFVKIKGKIYRRYYYGEFDSRDAAESVKNALEKESGKKLMVVKL